MVTAITTTDQVTDTFSIAFRIHFVTSLSLAGLSLKVILVGGLLGIGVFGTSFIGTIQTAIKDVSVQPPVSATLKKSTGEGATRGAMTRLTRREINSKLAQFPVFFAQNGDGGVFTEDSVGLIFADIADADAFAEIHSTKVSATSLDSFFFTLVQKKTKLSSYVDGVSRFSDPGANYKFVPSSTELANTPAGWNTLHPNDIPLFRIPTVAFSKEEGIELPLFVRKEDAVNAFERLQAAKQEKGEKGDDITSMNIQVISLLELVDLFSTGGFESRAFEIYPDIAAIESARKLMNR